MMNDMFARIVLTKRGNQIAVATAAAIVVALVVLIDNTRTGVMTMVALSAVESGLFVIVALFLSDWRKSDAMRAVVWAVFAYHVLAAHTFTLYKFPQRYWWSDDLRELIFGGLVVAGVNLTLTIVRLVRS